MSVESVRRKRDARMWEAKIREASENFQGSDSERMAMNDSMWDERKEDIKAKHGFYSIFD